MVVDDFDLSRAGVGPYEADAVLLVDGYAMLSVAVAAQCFEPIARWNGKFVQSSDGVQLVQFASSDAPQDGWTNSIGLSRSSTVKDIFGAFISEANDHL